nr:hypothetical protein [Tanacetum cinerariifolium]
MVPTAVLTQSKPVSITAVRPISAVVPKIMVTRPRHAHSIDTKSKSPIRRHMTRSLTSKTSNSPPRVTAAKAPVVSVAKGQTATGKEISNPFMAGSLPKTTLSTFIHSMSAKRTSWNEFSSAMASTVISCLLVQGNNNDDAQEADIVVTGDDVQDQSIPSPTSPTPPPQPPQDIPSISQVQSHPPQPQSPTLAQPQGVDLCMSLLQEALDACAALTRRVEHLEHDKMAQDLEIIKLKTRVKKLEKANKVKALKLRRLRKVGTSQRVVTLDDTIMEDESNQGRMIDELDRDEGAALISEKKEEKKAEEVKDITCDAQVEGRQAEIYQIDMDHAIKVLISAASIIIPAAEPKVPAATITVAPDKVAADSTRRRKRMVIRDPKEESSVKTPTKSKSKDKGKGIMDIDWDVAIDHVKQKAKEDPFVQRYQVMKKRPQTEAEARRNMMMYLKNTVGFRLDYFKGMFYDDIRPIFKAKFNSNIKFLLKLKERIEEEENRALESINETPAQKATNRRKLNEEVPVVDYQIVHFNNKPHYKIIRADETHQLYVSFITLLKNFDREDLESLWSLVKERFYTSKPNNFSDDYLLITLGAMFERPDGQDQMILLVERRYPLSRFTLDQMLNIVRLQVEEQSEMSLELLSFGVDAAMELKEKH